MIGFHFLVLSTRLNCSKQPNDREEEFFGLESAKSMSFPILIELALYESKDIQSHQDKAVWL